MLIKNALIIKNKIIGRTGNPRKIEAKWGKKLKFGL